MDESKLLFLDTHIDVLCFTETWLKPEISNASVEIKQFNLFRKGRATDSHGGICIYTRKGIRCRIVELLIFLTKYLIHSLPALNFYFWK